MQAMQMQNVAKPEALPIAQTCWADPNLCLNILIGYKTKFTNLNVPLIPAWLAGLPEGASSTRMPSSPSCLTVWGGAMVIPSTGRMTRPNLRI